MLHSPAAPGTAKLYLQPALATTVIDGSGEKQKLTCQKIAVLLPTTQRPHSKLQHLHHCLSKRVWSRGVPRDVGALQIKSRISTDWGKNLHHPVTTSWGPQKQSYLLDPPEPGRSDCSCWAQLNAPGIPLAERPLSAPRMEGISVQTHQTVRYCLPSSLPSPSIRSGIEITGQRLG